MTCQVGVIVGARQQKYKDTGSDAKLSWGSSTLQGYSITLPGDIRGGVATLGAAVNLQVHTLGQGILRGVQMYDGVSWGI